MKKLKIKEAYSKITPWELADLCGSDQSEVVEWCKRIKQTTGDYPWGRTVRVRLPNEIEPKFFILSCN